MAVYLGTHAVNMLGGSSSGGGGGGGSVTQDQDGYIVLPKTGGGGGGSSDFSTATITFINNSGYDTIIYAPVYYSDDEYYGNSSNYSVFSDGQNDSVANIILYKGEANISCENNINWYFASATGDVEIDSEYNDLAYVRGNGTITLSHQG